MAVMYAYGYKPKPSHIDEEVRLGDLSGVGNGPDLFAIVRDALTTPAEKFELPEWQVPKGKREGLEDPRSKFLEIDPGAIKVDAAERLIFGKVRMSRKAEAERKTKRETGESVQYDEDDPGDRPLFFLVSAPVQAPEALVVLESARPYGMVSFWRNELKKYISGRIPDAIYPVTRNGRTEAKDVILKWGAYGALETPEFIERFSDGTIDEAAATSTVGAGEPEHRMISVQRAQQVDRRRLAELVRRKDRNAVATMLFPDGMVDALGAEPEEVKFKGHFQGKERTIVISRATVSQPGLEVPRNARKEGSYVVDEVLRDLASELADTVGHGHTWA